MQNANTNANPNSEVTKTRAPLPKGFFMRLHKALGNSEILAPKNSLVLERSVWRIVALLQSCKLFPRSVQKP